jgi:hypothetical protein
LIFNRVKEKGEIMTRLFKFQTGDIVRYKQYEDTGKVLFITHNKDSGRDMAFVHWPETDSYTMTLFMHLHLMERTYPDGTKIKGGDLARIQ